MMRIFEGPTGKSRKGSMQLSINAIVILVLAMAVLGLGLGLVKGIRGKSDELMGYKVPLDREASATEPIANFDDSVAMTINKEVGYKISFYNKNTLCSDSSENYAGVRIECVKGTGGDDDVPVEMTVTQKKVEAKNGEATTIIFDATASSGAEGDPGFSSNQNYYCDLMVQCGVDDYGDPKIAAKYPFRLEI